MLRLILTLDKKTPGVTNWLIDNGLIFEVLLRFDPKESSTTHADASSLLEELLLEAKMNEEHVILNHFKEAIQEVDLFEFIEGSDSARIAILTLFETLLTGEVEGEDSMIIERLMDHFQGFVEILTTTTTSESSKPKQPFGLARLSTISFVATLVQHVPSVSEILVAEDFYNIALDLFFENPLNNVLHDCVLQLFLQLLSQKEELILEVFVSTNILDRIGEVCCDSSLLPFPIDLTPSFHSL